MLSMRESLKREVKLVTRLIDPKGKEVGKAESLHPVNAGDHFVFSPGCGYYQSPQVVNR